MIAPAASEYLDILSRVVLNQIRTEEVAWEKSVPNSAAHVIKSRRMFGLPEAASLK